MQQIQESVSSIQTSNEILREQSSQSIKAMTSDVKFETIKSVVEALNISTGKLESSAQKIRKIEKAKRQFFVFDKFRTFLFWAGCSNNLVTLALLVYFLGVD